MKEKLLSLNKEAWNAIADHWFGATALPIYGEWVPTETELNLFGDCKGKKILDIGCGSGHSLKYLGEQGALELWGLDISKKQIENAGSFLRESGFAPKLFCSPMEENPGIPAGYFDVVYSIYAIGWSMDLNQTFSLVSSYLKKDGIFIFSWDHPLLNCVEKEGDALLFHGSYFEKNPRNFLKEGKPLFAYHRKFSDYINSLAGNGFAIEALIEETDFKALEQAAKTSSSYYSPEKARKFPLSFIIKARKL